MTHTRRQHSPDKSKFLAYVNKLGVFVAAVYVGDVVGLLAGLLRGKYVTHSRWMGLCEIQEGKCFLCQCTT